MCELEQTPKATVSVKEVIRYLESARYLDKREAATFLHISVRNVTSRLSEIPHFRLGKKVLFKLSELQRYMEEKRERTVDLNRIVDEVLEDLRDA